MHVGAPIVPLSTLFFQTKLEVSANCGHGVVLQLPAWFAMLIDEDDLRAGLSPQCASLVHRTEQRPVGAKDRFGDLPCAKKGLGAWSLHAVIARYFSRPHSVPMRSSPRYQRLTKDL